MFAFAKLQKSLPHKPKYGKCSFFAKTGCQPNISAKIQIVPYGDTTQRSGKNVRRKSKMV
jgi:hypothetical protein